MEMKVGVQRRAEAMEKAHGAHGGGLRSRWAGFFEGSRQGPKEDVKDSAGGPGSVMEVGSQALGDGQNPLSHRHVGKDMVHQVRSRFGHALGVTGGAGASALAGKGHEEVVAAGCASSPGEPMSQDAALQVASELRFHVVGYAVAHGVGLIGQGEVGLQVFPDDTVERGGFGAPTTIGVGMGVGRWPGWWCGPPGLPASRVGLNRHQRPSASRGARRLVSTSRTSDGWGGGMGEGARGQATGREGLQCPSPDLRCSWIALDLEREGECQRAVSVFLDLRMGPFLGTVPAHPGRKPFVFKAFQVAQRL
jgi:hypothetical protein